MSKRKEYIEKNTEAITFLATKVKLLNCLNLQDLNIHLENTFRDLLNLLYQDRKFINLNSVDGNYTAIDLGDDKKDIAIQVTSTTTKKKVISTIEKFKEDHEYKKVYMLYCVLDKPKRKDNFSSIIEGKFDFDEWDLKDLLKKVNDAEFNILEKISQLIEKDIFSGISNNEIHDSSASEQWENTTPSDIRNLKEKMLAVCSSVHEARTNKYSRDIASGKVELSRHSDRDVSSMRFRIFEVCQEELINFIETSTKKELSIDEVKNLIERYTNKAFTVIEDKSKDYAYPLKNKDILRKVVLALIDECYLSFDEEGVYNEK